MGGEPRRNRNSPPTSTPAYTLVELVVVIGVISLLMAVTIPSVSWMWESTRLADAENKLTGLLRSARMRSLNKADSGLFFFIENGVQKIAFIEADPPNLNPNPDGSASVDAGGNGTVGDGDDVTESATADRFRVLTDTVYDLRAPFRVVPIDVLRERAPDVFLWTDEQLGNDNYENPPDTADNYIHRNFFTLLFSPNGRLLVGRSVLIRDADVVTDGTRELGVITTLAINDAGDFYDDAGNSTPVPMPTPQLPAMIVDVIDVALNFPSVDGLLVYDDTLFRGYPDEAVEPIENKRRFLMRTARPFYISRQTGAIIKGPLGENEP